MTRQHLPARRSHETVELVVGPNRIRYVAGIGRHEDGSIAEVFLDAGKSGTDLHAVARDAAVVASLAIQHGVPLDTIRHAVTREANGHASGPIGALLDQMEANHASHR